MRQSGWGRAGGAERVGQSGGGGSAAPRRRSLRLASRRGMRAHVRLQQPPGKFEQAAETSGTMFPVVNGDAPCCFTAVFV